MLILKDRDLQRLREEYITATIENMSQQQIVAYLRQILHNEISHSTGEELAKKITSNVRSVAFTKELTRDLREGLNI